MPVIEEPLTKPVRPGVEETPPVPHDFVRPEIPAKYKTIGEYLRWRREKLATIWIAEYIESKTPPGACFVTIPVSELVGNIDRSARVVQGSLARLIDLGMIRLHYTPKYRDLGWKHWFVGWRLPLYSPESSTDGRRPFR